MSLKFCRIWNDLTISSIILEKFFKKSFKRIKILLRHLKIISQYLCNRYISIFGMSTNDFSNEWLLQNDFFRMSKILVSSFKWDSQSWHNGWMMVKWRCLWIIQFFCYHFLQVSENVCLLRASSTTAPSTKGGRRQKRFLLSLLNWSWSVSVAQRFCWQTLFRYFLQMQINSFKVSS